MTRATFITTLAALAIITTRAASPGRRDLEGRNPAARRLGRGRRRARPARRHFKKHGLDLEILYVQAGRNRSRR